MRTHTVRLAIAQINPTVGDLRGNEELIMHYLDRIKGFDVDLIAFPELAVTGYPPEDLLMKPHFIQDNLKAIGRIGKAVKDVVAVIGFVDKKGGRLFNAAAVAYEGKIAGVYHKMRLPNYGVFDEKRYFSEGKAPLVFGLGSLIVGVNICEDIWHSSGPLSVQAKKGAKLIININASPYHAGKSQEREAMITRQARTHRVALCYANIVGGQDELVFDGASMVTDTTGVIISRAEAFKEDLTMADVKITLRRAPDRKQAIRISGWLPRVKNAYVLTKTTKPLGPQEEIYEALRTGLYNYVAKNGFRQVVIGLSGGIDSSFVALLATDALGKDNVIGVFMPSRYSSKESMLDASLLASNLGIKFIQISIEQIYRIYLLMFEPHFLGSERGIAEENLQARIRGNILMTLSNKFGWLPLSTGNKSELSTGYTTLYGDMAGGFAPIKDVPKTLLYRLAQHRNSRGLIIPERVFTKEPTAELRHGQKDRDTLLPYEVLDPILKAYIEQDLDQAHIASLGFSASDVQKAIQLVDGSEYKRRQSPPGVKITPRAFGRDRRMPITNKYRE
ncbi:MAG: NAD+ synthase [Candidatus Omnitrophota bacterium]